jgi:Isocitrate/isopropylmalate dehydrogenase
MDDNTRRTHAHAKPIVKFDLCVRHRFPALVHSFQMEFKEALIGGAAIDATGSPFPDATFEQLKQSDSVLLSAIGGPNVCMQINGCIPAYPFKCAVHIAVVR